MPFQPCPARPHRRLDAGDAAAFLRRSPGAATVCRPVRSRLIARTDARAVEGVDAAIGRRSAYGRAGADMLLVEAPATLEEAERFATPPSLG